MNSINNCDSTIILNLNILESSSAQISDTFSFGGNYDFNGILLDSSGTYVQIITNSVCCDSIITLALIYMSGLESKLDISDLKSGIYILEFSHKNIIWNKKIIISN